MRDEGFPSDALKLDPICLVVSTYNEVVVRPVNAGTGWIPFAGRSG